jgi:hypothetical protein
MATKKNSKAPNPKQQTVLIRTYSAGVHVGKLVSRAGKEVVLADARRIWRWYGANTLHELSLTGVDSARSRISQPVSEITLTEAIEVLPLTDAALATIEKTGWAP